MSTTPKRCNPDMLGPVARGFHAHSFVIAGKKIDFGFAVLDMLATVIISFVVSKLTGKSFIIIFAAFMLLGVFLHWYFCVPTGLSDLLGFGKNVTF